MGMCDKYEPDPRCEDDVSSGYIGRGCISCRHSHPVTGCSVSGRGRDGADGTYLSDSGRKEDWYDED